MSRYQLLSRPPVDNEPRLSFHKLGKKLNRLISSGGFHEHTQSERLSSRPVCERWTTLSFTCRLSHANGSAVHEAHRAHTPHYLPLSSRRLKELSVTRAGKLRLPGIHGNTVHSPKAGGALRKEQMGEEKMWHEVHSGHTVFPRCFTLVSSVFWAVSWRLKPPKLHVASVFELLF